MENENTNEKKKQKVAILIGVVTLLIAVLGATYAYFQISTDTESSNTNITGSTPPKSLVTLRDVTSNLHLNISASDMSLANANNEYYGTDVEEKSYEDNESDGTKTIAEVELTGGEATTKYSCTAKLTVSKVTEPEEYKDTMIEVLQPGDMILQFKGNIINEKLDLSELNPDGSKEYNLSFKVTGNTPEAIQAYIKLVNKETQQNYLTGKKLNIDISTSDLKCNIYLEHPNIKYLRENDPEGKLSDELIDDLYRYQGNSITDEYGDEIQDTLNNNYICLGDNCTVDSDDMYRIIGINEDGEMKVIKNVPMGDETSFDWDTIMSEESTWPGSTLYQTLNNEFIGYLPEDLQSKIISSQWKYGSVIPPGCGYNADGYKCYNEDNQNVFTVEELAKYKELYDAISGYDGSELNDNQKREKIKEISKLESEALVRTEMNFTETIGGNISLINIIDYCNSFESNSELNCRTSSYAFSLNDTLESDYGVSWLSFAKYHDSFLTSTKSGLSYGSSDYDVWEIFYNGNLSNRDFYGSVGPVFYLSSDIELSGEGTIMNPYKIGIIGTYLGPHWNGPAQ